MRITEAAARLGMSPRMLRYREDLGLLPPLRDRPYGRGHAHRQFTDEDLAAITAALAIERRFDITPAALAFGLRVLTEPAVRAAVADLGRRTGHVPPGPGAGRALDFEKERALRALGGAPRDPARREPLVVAVQAVIINAPGGGYGERGGGSRPRRSRPTGPPGLPVPGGRCPAPGRWAPRSGQPRAPASPRRRCPQKGPRPSGRRARRSLR